MDFSLTNSPDLKTEPIFGIRIFRQRNNYLYPVFQRKYGTMYKPGGNRIYHARCTASGFHESPGWDCKCGFYAFKPDTPWNILRAHMPGLLQAYSCYDCTIYGVLLWGKVIEHTLGWRAGSMRVLHHAEAEERFPGYLGLRQRLTIEPRSW